MHGAAAPGTETARFGHGVRAGLSIAKSADRAKAGATQHSPLHREQSASSSTPTLDHVQRVMVVGNPGSGKSTLARALGERLDLPVVHLDRLFWRPGWQAASKDEFRAALTPLAAPESWVIEGNYSSTFDLRMPRADLVVVLDLPRRTTIPATLRRAITYRGRSRPDMGEDCPEKVDLEFLRYQWRYPAEQAPKVEQALAEFAVPDERVVRLTSHAATSRWLAARSTGV